MLSIPSQSLAALWPLLTPSVVGCKRNVTVSTMKMNFLWNERWIYGITVDCRDLTLGSDAMPAIGTTAVLEALIRVVDRILKAEDVLLKHSYR